MAEYIEKQAAIDTLREYFSDEEDAEVEYGAYWYHTSVEQCIKEMQSADVRPVVRGKWEHLNWGFDYDRCSVCGYEHRWPGPFYFCPNCGADMRGEDDGN